MYFKATPKCQWNSPHPLRILKLLNILLSEEYFSVRVKGISKADQCNLSDSNDQGQKQ